MPNKTTTDETTRSPIDGSELIRLATPGANWKAQLQIFLETIGIFHVGTVPVTSTDPGTPFSYALDNAGNLYVCYAPNTWAKFFNMAPFGINHILTEAGDFLDTEAGDRLVTES